VGDRTTRNKKGIFYGSKTNRSISNGCQRGQGKFKDPTRRKRAIEAYRLLCLVEKGTSNMSGTMRTGSHRGLGPLHAKGKVKFVIFLRRREIPQRVGAARNSTVLKVGRSVSPSKKKPAYSRQKGGRNHPPTPQTLVRILVRWAQITSRNEIPHMTERKPAHVNAHKIGRSTARV